MYADNLIADHKEMCKFAFERGSLDKLASLVKSITPSEKTVEWEEDEPESISCLREVSEVILAAGEFVLTGFCAFLVSCLSLGCPHHHWRDVAL